MNKDKYVFAQLVQFMDQFKFIRIVKKYEGDKYVKSFSCWNQLLTMMFGQLTNRESLRDLIVATEAHSGKLYHLGMGKSVTRSNLSKANEQRNYRIFEDYAKFMIEQARKRRLDKIFELEGHVYAFDSTTIDLCLSVFEWAKFRKHKGGIKMHTLYDVEAQVPAFVHITPANVHDTKAMPEISYEEGAHYIFDRGYNDYGNLFKINIVGGFFVLRAKTNVIKQHLRIKRFWGISENAVRIQIYCAIITYCLVAIVKHDMKLERSIYEILQILGISLTDKTHIRDLFNKKNINDVKDLYGSSEQNLFNVSSMKIK